MVEKCPECNSTNITKENDKLGTRKCNDCGHTFLLVWIGLGTPVSDKEAEEWLRVEEEEN